MGLYLKGRAHSIDRTLILQSITQGHPKHPLTKTSLPKFPKSDPPHHPKYDHSSALY